MTRFRIGVGAIAILAASGMARADDAAPKAAMDHMEMDRSTTGGTPADKAFAASMQKMMKEMDAKPTGNADRDFVTMMIPHHRGAIDMAKVQLQYGNDPMLRKLAAAIVRAQDSEIAEMKAWLDKHGG